jgi:two-component sensor histidine kinase
MTSADNPPPVVEPAPQSPGPNLTLTALEQRIKQQEILAEFGVRALQGASFDELLNEAARLAAEGLNAEFSKVLEYIPSENKFLVRAGFGWEEGIIGVAFVAADLASPAGFALRTGRPVISNQLENEQRFRTPEILQRHGVRRAMNVILQGDGRPFGVLEVDSRSETDFVEHDLAFLQGAANLLGMAIERERHQRSLTAALNHHKVLLKEMNHRIKNSLTMVASMLNLHTNEIADPEAIQQIEEATHRVEAIAKAHEQLSFSSNIESMDVGAYIKTICENLGATVAHIEVNTQVEEGIEISTGRAISAALMVNELITNAAKYAYDGERGGKVWITLARSDQDNFVITVRDEGAGLPKDFDTAKPKSLGMRIVALLGRQLDAKISVRRPASGSEFIISLPINTPDSSL